MNLEYIFISYIEKSIKFDSITFKKNFFEVKSNEILLEQKTIPIDSNKFFYSNMANSITEEFNFNIDEFFSNLDNKKIKKQALKLTSLQKTVLYKLYVDNDNEKNISKQLNCSLQNINKIKKSALKKLKI